MDIAAVPPSLVEELCSAQHKGTTLFSTKPSHTHSAKGKNQNSDNEQEAAVLGWIARTIDDERESAEICGIITAYGVCKTGLSQNTYYKSCDHFLTPLLTSDHDLSSSSI